MELILKEATNMQQSTLKIHAKMLTSKSKKSLYFPELGPSLFLHSDNFAGTKLETNMFKLMSVHQEAFFGRTISFQYCDNLKMAMIFVPTLLAATNDYYKKVIIKDSQASENAQPVKVESFLIQLVKILMFCPKYIINPELRARKASTAILNGAIGFSTVFWRLSNSPLVQLANNMVTPTLDVNIVIKISLASSLKLPRIEYKKKYSNIKDRKRNSTIINEIKCVDILPPEGATSKDTVQIRIFSHVMLQGMVSCNPSLNDNIPALDKMF